MTAIASPPPLQSFSRNGWSNGTGHSVNAMSSDDLSRMLIPRKSAQRTGSSSSLSSTSSTSTTVAVTSTQQQQPNGNTTTNGDVNWATRKKPARALWPSSKAEPVASISTARSHSVPATSTGTSAASAISSLQSPATLLPSQQSMQPQTQQNGGPRPQNQQETSAVLHLVPVNGTFEPKTITVPFGPDLLRVGRQTNQKTVPSPINGYFDSKVLSRQHAEIWADRDGKIWIRDVKSSNGTFVNNKRLSPENRESEPHPLKEQDLLELGIDIVSEDQKTVVHHKVAARVEHAGIYPGSSPMDLSFGDLDSPALGNPLSQPTNQNLRRTASQGSNGNNNRFGGAVGNGVVNNVGAAAYQSKWLQPVTMEQIVKRLNTELRQAKIQSKDLQHTGNFVDSMLNMPASLNGITGPQQQNTSSPTKSVDNIKARFATSPPAPPPSQPLPEAPISANKRTEISELPPLQPSLRRSDTEKPKGFSNVGGSGNSPINTDPDSQILSLVEALTTAQREIESQSERLKEMDDALQKEREERRLAEERAGSRGSESSTLTPHDPLSRSVEDDVTPDLAASADASTLQRRLDLMRAEMDEMKQQMEKYRQRAISAEEESERDRKSLAEMVESIRQRDEALRRKREKRQRQRAAASRVDGSAEETLKRGTDKAAVEGVQDDDDDFDVDDDIDGEVERANHRLQQVARNVGLGLPPEQLANGSANLGSMSSEHLHELGKAVSAAISSAQQRQGAGGDVQVRGLQRSRRQEQLVQSAPYASILGVVLLGVGMMAYLNGWQKVAER